MFKPYPESGVTNAYLYKDVKVRFTYRVDIGSNRIGGVDIDGVFPGEEKEMRFFRYDGPFDSKELALEAAMEWTAKYLDRELSGGNV